jgi:murein DD-endopeptidase MepM/ murein hydrolase activator NlpD
MSTFDDIEESVKWSKRAFFVSLLGTCFWIFIIGWIVIANTCQADEVYCTPMANNTTLSAVYNTLRPEGLHRALDIICAMFTPIRSISDGYVYQYFYSETNDPKTHPNGNYVIIKMNNGYYALYAHLSTFKVLPGEIIQKGQYFAWSGNSGRSRGPHLHLQVFDKDGNPVKITFFFGINWQLAPGVKNPDGSYAYQSGQ